MRLLIVTRILIEVLELLQGLLNRERIVRRRHFLLTKPNALRREKRRSRRIWPPLPRQVVLVNHLIKLHPINFKGPRDAALEGKFEFRDPKLLLRHFLTRDAVFNLLELLTLAAHLRSNSASDSLHRFELLQRDGRILLGRVVE